MLALQMIRIMDRIWLQEGLDLRIANFKCISTGKDKGSKQPTSFSTSRENTFVKIAVVGRRDGGAGAILRHPEKDPGGVWRHRLL